MKKWIVMLAMLSLLTACAQTPEPAELTKLSAATSESADAERNSSFSANQCADRSTHRYPGTDRHALRSAKADT